MRDTTPLELDNNILIIFKVTTLVLGAGLQQISKNSIAKE